MFFREEIIDIPILNIIVFVCNKQIILYGFSTISNHTHMIIQFKDFKLSDFVRDFNKCTAKTILKKMQNKLESRLEWMPGIL